VAVLVDPTTRQHSRRLHLTNGTWSGAIRVPAHAPPGRWTVQLNVTDAVGNGASWTTRSLRTVIGRTVAVRVISDLDHRSPVLSQVTLSPSEIDVRYHPQHVTMTVTARDAETGVRNIQASLNQRANAAYGSTSLLDLHRVSGTTRAGRWRAHFDIPAWAPAGRWDPWLDVTDNAGHHRFYSRGNSLGSPPARSGKPLKLRPVLVQSALDHDLPVVDSLDLSLGAIDVREAAQSVTFDVHARDATSGLAPPFISLESNHVQVVFPMRFVDGTLNDGTWRAVWTPTPCDAVAGTWTVRVSYLSDRTHNLAVGTGPVMSLVVQGDDRRPPTYTTWTADRAGVPVVFDEDIAGITAASASLRHFPGGWRDPRNTPVTGHWECRTVDSAPVDCGTGPVRVATFRPDTPLIPGAYRVAFNPEHVLSVTDLAGNPVSNAAQSFINIR